MKKQQVNVNTKANNLYSPLNFWRQLKSYANKCKKCYTGILSL
jgi:hypothetical protein